VIEAIRMVIFKVSFNCDSTNITLFVMLVLALSILILISDDRTTIFFES
jgi:hypothetical protein